MTDIIERLHNIESLPLSMIRQCAHEAAIEIARLRNTPVPQERETLWGCAEIAEYLGISYRHARDVVTKSASFPRPTRVPGKGARGRARWSKATILQWAGKR